MLSPRWSKVLRDLGTNRTRTLLVVLSIAVGVFAIGTIVTTQVILERDLTRSYLAVNPTHATLFADPFGDDVVDAARRLPGVADAEGRRDLTVQIHLANGRLGALQLLAVADYNNMRINKLQPVSGAWPPGRNEVLLERQSLAYLGVHTGDTLTVETPDGRQRQLPVTGVVHDVVQSPSQFSGIAYGYVSFDTFAWLGMPRNYDRLNLLVTGKTLDQPHIRAVAETVRAKIEKGGLTVYYVNVPTPGAHPADSIIQPVIMLLGAIGLISLLASGFLVINTISALLAQQVRQIGVMKAIGARSYQITQMYLGMALAFGVLALVLAVPLGAAAAWLVTRTMAGLVNVDLAGFSVPPQVLLLETIMGLAVPLLAALYPVISAARITVREAISTYGLGDGTFGAGVIDRLLERVQILSRPLLLSLRNTFRRKGRLAITLLTLTLSGTIFIAVFSVHASLLNTLEDALRYWNYDVGVSLGRVYRSELLEQEALKVPGVTAVESWGFETARRLRPDDSAGSELTVVAPNANTRMLQPRVLAGRWLDPADENAIVVNTDLLKEERDIQIGQEIVLKIGSRKTTWRVVGIVQGLLTGQIAYANYPYFAGITNSTGQAAALQIGTAQHDAAYQAQVSQALQAQFKADGIRLAGTDTVSEMRGRVERQFNIIVTFLLIMAVVLAAVGGLGLMGTMSLNVLERSREIGIMRSIGAADGAVQEIVIVEGVLIGLISWGVAVIAAGLLGKGLSDSVGNLLLKTPLSYVFSTGGALLWLAAVVIISTLASFAPARRATRMSVREVLAYE